MLFSIGIFANSLMRYNKLLEEQRQLTKKLQHYQEAVAELTELLGSADELRRVLNDYEIYQQLKQNGDLTGEKLAEYEELFSEMRELLADPDVRETVIRLARENGLAFPDEIIYYNDVTPKED